MVGAPHGRPEKTGQSKMSEQGPQKKKEPSADKKSESSEKASKEWLKDYLRNVYGVGMQGAQKDLAMSGQHYASNVIADEFVFRLLARFNDLDVAPCDGFLSMAEVEFAINNPRLHFDQHDKLMLAITKRYYHQILEVCSEENEEEDHREGLSRKDLEILSTSHGKSCTALRNRLEQEFAVREPA
jgi:hypothetical protein